MAAPHTRHCEELATKLRSNFALMRRSNPVSFHGDSLDCFAEPVIGPRFAWTRWLAVTMQRQGFTQR